MSLKSVFNKAMFSLVRIRTLTETGNTMHGTGFVYEYVAGDNAFPFLVTSSKLVEQAVEGRMALMQAKGKEPLLGKGYTLDIDQFSKLWFSHPDSDIGVSVTPFVPFVRHVENTGTRIYFNAFTESDNPDDSFFEAADFGQQVSILGYPTGYWDRKQLLPVSRQTGIASLPSLDYIHRHQLLLDTELLSGWLGAPILARTGEGARLVGLMAHGGSSNAEDADQTIQDTNSMAVMLKSEAMMETIRAYLKEKGFI